MMHRRDTDPRYIAHRAAYDSINQLADAMSALNHGDLLLSRQHLTHARDLINEALRQLPKIARNSQKTSGKT